MRIQLWSKNPGNAAAEPVAIKINGEESTVHSGDTFDLVSGERITLLPGVFHEFWPVTESCVIGEVSTTNDDALDNIFADAEIGRFPAIEEDEPALVRLVSE